MEAPCLDIVNTFDQRASQAAARLQIKCSDLIESYIHVVLRKQIPMSPDNGLCKHKTTFLDQRSECTHTVQHAHIWETVKKISFRALSCSSSQPIWRGDFLLYLSLPMLGGYKDNCFLQLLYLYLYLCLYIWACPCLMAVETIGRGCFLRLCWAVEPARAAQIWCQVRPWPLHTLHCSECWPLQCFTMPPLSWSKVGFWLRCRLYTFPCWLTQWRPL